MFDFLNKKDRTPPALPEGTVRRRYTITGQVQGVGFRATSSTYGHWVCVAGISSTADPENLTESDFYALDPARVTANGRLAVTRLLDDTLWVENSPLKVLG